jgi:hypothetical protein
MKSRTIQDDSEISLEKKYVEYPSHKLILRRGKVKTKHDITWFAQKTNVDQLNSAYVYDSGGQKKNSFCLRYTGC